MTDTRISAGHWSAVVDAHGCTLRSVEHDGRPLLSAPPALDPSSGHHGAVLAPWPGRTVGARYPFAGAERRLRVNEPAFGHALHGFVFDRLWRRTAVDPVGVTHEVVLGAQPGYPWTMRLRVAYRVDESGIRCDAEWTNLGDGTAPFGLGFHPYLTVGDGTVDEWTLHLAAGVSCDSDPASKHPLPARPTRVGVDFVRPRRIGGDRFSRAYGRLERHGGVATARVSASDGFALELGVDEGFRWLQVFTADLPAPALARRGIAIEPQTCPPDAFNSGIDLDRVAPGASSRATWTLRLAS